MMFLSSVISGAIGGMGIGGGVVLIPVLTGFFGIGQREAQFINLVYFVPVAICALIVHKKSGSLEWRKAMFMAAGGVVGAWSGSAIASKIGLGLLKRLFGAFLFVIGIMQFKTKDKK